jgi:cyclophilin family peptidyl-prolyl cis-trans isomerase
MPNRLLIALFLAVPAVAGEPGPIPDKLRTDLKLDKFYQKTADAGGLPIVASAKVSDNALAEAAWIVGKMLDGREDILKAMKEARVRVAVMAIDEFTTDLPDHASMKPKLYWDRRARGLGATPRNPCVSCGEENLLGCPGDPYPDENIFVHEFSHAIHGTGLNKVDPTFDRRLRAAYDAAKERGLWKNTYAMTNHSEYWAEGVQSWFDDNARPNALHNDIRTRAKLKEYDKELAKLCEEVFGDKEWRYLRPAKRKAEDTKHLTNFDAKKLPRFVWREAAIGDKPRATLQTAAGEFDVELDAKAAPEAVAAFLKIAADGGFHSGKFTQAVRSEDKGQGRVAAQVKANYWTDATVKRLKLADVPEAKLKPADGTIALTRDGKNVGGFVIFVGTPTDPPTSSRLARW